MSRLPHVLPLLLLPLFEWPQCFNGLSKPKTPLPAIESFDLESLPLLFDSLDRRIISSPSLAREIRAMQFSQLRVSLRMPAEVSCWLSRMYLLLACGSTTELCSSSLLGVLWGTALFLNEARLIVNAKFQHKICKQMDLRVDSCGGHCEVLVVADLDVGAVGAIGLHGRVKHPPQFSVMDISLKIGFG